MQRIFVKENVLIITVVSQFILFKIFMFLSWDDEVTNTLRCISLYTVKFLMFMLYEWGNN
jgi:hypothetical protein